MYLLDTPSLSTQVFKNKVSMGCESPASVEFEKQYFNRLEVSRKAGAIQAHLHTALSAANQGKADRFIQACLREWAYGRVWDNSAERTAWLPAFLAYYNARSLTRLSAINLQLHGSPGTTYCNS